VNDHDDASPSEPSRETREGAEGSSASRRAREQASKPARSPFQRYARVHAIGAASDAAIAVTLAGSIFFSISPDDSRGRVALYLALTMAPFAIVAPLLGPVIDRARGGRRFMVVASAAGRSVLAFLMIDSLGSLWLFPLAFAILVLQKTYSVAKSAVVPSLVSRHDDLVSANSRLALISAVSSMVGGSVAGLLSLIGGPPMAAGVAMFGFTGMTMMALRIAPVAVTSNASEAEDRAALRDASVLLAAYAIAILRGIVGFVTFMLAFEFRGGADGLDVSSPGSAAGAMTATVRGIDITGDPAAPVWHFGLVLVMAGLGAFLGARIAPLLRARISEVHMLQAALAVVALAAVFAAISFDLFGAMVLSFSVAIGASTGKLAFDSQVQRSAPDANYGRSFARFETRFQGAWVVGAFIPVVIPLNLAVGGTGVAIAAAVALGSFVIGRPFHSLVAVPFGRRWPRRIVGKRNRARAVAPTPTPQESQLTSDDLRPSQPEAPAGTTELAHGWETPMGPTFSSAEGVESGLPDDESTEDGGRSAR
jgi:hypothetical protein